jgi:hypothetical protein
VRDGCERICPDVCEVAAYAKSAGQTMDELLDQIFSQFGYFEEKNGSLVFEGRKAPRRLRVWSSRIRASRRSK